MKNRRKRYSRCRQYLPSITSNFSIRSKGPIRLWYFPRDMYQARVCGRQKRSSACVLIALFTAANRLREDANPIHLSPILDTTFANSVVENMIIANQLCDESRSSRNRRTGRFQIPEATTVINRYESEISISEICHQTIKGEIFTISIFQRCVKRIARFWDGQFAKKVMNRKEYPNICFIHIVNRRSILVTYQPSNRILLFVDSHSHDHGRKGALVDAAKLDDSNLLISKVFKELFPIKGRRGRIQERKAYEISVLTIDE